MIEAKTLRTMCVASKSKLGKILLLGTHTSNLLMSLLGAKQDRESMPIAHCNTTETCHNVFAVQIMHHCDQHEKTLLVDVDSHTAHGTRSEICIDFSDLRQASLRSENLKNNHS